MTGPQELATLALPGTRFFAPQARIVDKEGEPITVLGRPIDADLVSARVTQTHQGISQVSLTLNNQRHEIKKEYRPLIPSWKYNGLDEIKFGQTVRVQFRYGSNDKDWRPMILARVTDIAFSFPSGGGAQLTLQGEDDLSLLKTKPKASRRYPPSHEVEMVADALDRSKCGLALAPAGPPAGRTREKFREKLTTVTHQDSVTYHQFIESLAERLDYEVFVDFDDPTDKNSPVKLHFEPARSTVFNAVVDLTWNKDLVEFKPKFKVWEVYTAATAKGRHPRRRRRFEESAYEKALDADLHTAPGEAKPLNAIQARNKFFPGTENVKNCPVTNLDPERARRKATAELLKQARHFLTAEASTIGFTRIRPGIHVNIKGLYAPFDGIYYVTKAVHSIDSSGFTTRCSLRRPGMLDPSGYPGGSTR